MREMEKTAVFTPSGRTGNEDPAETVLRVPRKKGKTHMLLRPPEEGEGGLPNVDR